MSQSLARIPIHMIFGTKNRTPWITDPVRDALHAYMGAVMKTKGVLPIGFGSVEDHAHLLFDLGRSQTISDVAEEVKSASSRWLKTQAPERFLGLRPSLCSAAPLALGLSSDEGITTRTEAIVRESS